MKMRKQRCMGVALLVVSAVIWLLASTGETVEERDGTALLLTFPLGIYLLVSKTYLLNDREEDNERKDTIVQKPVFISKDAIFPK